MRRALAAAAVAAVAAVVLTGCGDTGQSSDATETRTADPSAGTTPTPVETDDAAEAPSDEASDHTAVEIEIEGDTITPNGKRLEVGTGETVTLEVDSDRPGAFHVHATPEQELEFGAGHTTLELTIDTPGLVDVEEHEAGIVVAQLEVG